jgi:protease I
MANDLKGMKIAIIVTDMFEEVEMTEPRQALDDAGATTYLLAPKDGELISANHFDKSEKYTVDDVLGRVDPIDFDALLLPGGALNADLLRMEPKVQEFIQHFDEMGKPIAAICHAPWELISAGVVEGRSLTSFHTIQDDIKNAAGEWSDQEVVIDGNWVTSRKPDDIPAFNKAMLKLFIEAHQNAPALV